MRKYFSLIALMCAVMMAAGCSCAANPSDTVVGIRNPFKAVSLPTVAPTQYGVMQAVPQPQYRLVPIAPAAPAAAAAPSACVPYTPGFSYAPVVGAEKVGPCAP